MTVGPDAVGKDFSQFLLECFPPSPLNDLPRTTYTYKFDGMQPGVPVSFRDSTAITTEMTRRIEFTRAFNSYDRKKLHHWVDDRYPVQSNGSQACPWNWSPGASFVLALMENIKGHGYYFNLGDPGLRRVRLHPKYGILPSPYEVAYRTWVLGARAKGDLERVLHGHEKSHTVELTVAWRTSPRVETRFEHALAQILRRSSLAILDSPEIPITEDPKVPSMSDVIDEFPGISPERALWILERKNDAFKAYKHVQHGQLLNGNTRNASGVFMGSPSSSKRAGKLAVFDAIYPEALVWAEQDEWRGSDWFYTPKGQPDGEGDDDGGEEEGDDFVDA